jgi:hypothetical protein
MRELAKEDVVVAYVNLMTAPTKEKLAEKLAGATFEGIASPLERARERALTPFRGLRIAPTITVDPEDGTYSFSFAVDRSPPDVDATLERLLQLPAELTAGETTRAALVFDEFQEIEAIDRSLPKLMRTIFEQQPEVSRVYLGSRRHLMERLFDDEQEPFWRSAKKVELDGIEPALFRDFIAARFRSTRKKVGMAVVDALLDKTGGHPYATQELCYFLWEETPFDGLATAAELESAVAATLRSEHAHFQVRWDNASALQKVILEALAREPGRPLTAAYRSRHGLPSVSATQAALRALVERELVTRAADGSYRIAEPLLDEWIRAL